MFNFIKNIINPITVESVTELLDRNRLVYVVVDNTITINNIATVTVTNTIHVKQEGIVNMMWYDTMSEFEEFISNNKYSLS